MDDLRNPDIFKGSLLAVVVILSILASFFLPRDWFIEINPAAAEIYEIKNSLVAVEKNYTTLQEKKRDTERALQATETDLAAAHEGLINASKSVNPIVVSTKPLESVFAGLTSTPIDRALRSSDLNRMLPPLEGLRREIQTAFNDSKRASDALQTARSKLIELENIRNGRRTDIEQMTNRISALEEDKRRFSVRLRQIEKESIDQHLALRAFALGAFGAFAAALASFLHGSSKLQRLPSGRCALSMIFGGIVALVVFALFTTREISVFSVPTVSADQVPDFWRVVILCIVAGAFADRLFAAAQDRVDQATQQQNNGNNGANTAS